MKLCLASHVVEDRCGSPGFFMTWLQML